MGWSGARGLIYRNYIRWSVYRRFRRHDQYSLVVVDTVMHFELWISIGILKNSQWRICYLIIRGVRETDLWKNLKSKIYKISVCQFPFSFRFFIKIGKYIFSIMWHVFNRWKISKHIYANFLNYYCFLVYSTATNEFDSTPIASPVKEKE